MPQISNLEMKTDNETIGPPTDSRCPEMNLKYGVKDFI